MGKIRVCLLADGHKGEFVEVEHNVSASGSTELLSSGEQTAIVFAARYSHTRNTGGSSVIVNTILANWNRLSLETQKQLKREARNEATCNFDDWEKVLDR